MRRLFLSVSVILAAVLLVGSSLEAYSLLGKAAEAGACRGCGLVLAELGIYLLWALWSTAFLAGRIAIIIFALFVILIARLRNT